MVRGRIACVGGHGCGKIRIEIATLSRYLKRDLSKIKVALSLLKREQRRGLYHSDLINRARPGESAPCRLSGHWNAISFFGLAPIGGMPLNPAHFISWRDYSAWHLMKYGV